MGHPKMQHPLLKEPSKRTTYSSDSQTFSACGALRKKKKKNSRHTYYNTKLL